MTRHQVRDLLLENHVVLRPLGTARLVPITELREKLHWFYQALVEAEHLRRLAG